MVIDGIECYLVDDGTLDTVISVDGEEVRYDLEYVEQYRNNTGTITDNGFKELCEESIEYLYETEYLPHK